MNIEKKSNRFCWKIENFGLYFLTQTEPLESPPFKIAGVGSNVYFRLALFKEIHKKEVRVACYLNVTEWSRPPANMRLDGTVTLKMPKGNINFVLQRAAIPKLVGSTLLIGTTTWSDTTYSKSDFVNCSLSIMLNLRRSPLFGSRHCSTVTHVEKQIKKHVETLKPSFPFSMILFEIISEGNSEDFIWKQMSSRAKPIAIFLKERKYSAHLKCILSLEDQLNTPRRSTEMEHKFDDRRGIIWWYLNDYFPFDILKEKDPDRSKNDFSMCIKIEANLTFYEDIGSTQEYFSDSHPETSKTLRHRLKNDLERFFRSSRKGCDLIFRCEKKDFPVHKSLICCKSTVFSKMFESDMKEKKFGIVEMDDTDSLTLSRFIEYLYLGSVTDSTLDLNSAMALYAIAHRYSILDLVNYSRKFLVFNMDCGNSDEMLQFADLYDDKTLKNLINFCFLLKDDYIVECKKN
ncbi:protein roadkill [Trichonephila clavipes]|nr:protein roadkill [Trichonephila clavipes]